VGAEQSPVKVETGFTAKDCDYLKKFLDKLMAR
jgi:hypothetical protein